MNEEPTINNDSSYTDDKNEVEWVGCCGCDRRYHVKCIRLLRLLSNLTEELYVNLVKFYDRTV